MKKYRWIITGLTLSIILWLAAAGLKLNLFESFVFCLNRHEHLEIDELIFPAALFYVFLMIHLVRRHHRNLIEIEKLKIYRVTLKAMNHILNNFLQKMLLFKLTAEETKGFNPEILKQYDTIIREATAQIDALECITDPDEKIILQTIEPGRHS